MCRMWERFDQVSISHVVCRTRRSFVTYTNNSVDYTGFSEISRASISMAHDTASLTVSLEEAARLEKSTTARLKRERKLSLIVDLDQTIIHATVDPTVGDWMFDAKNPNYPVLKDVKRFRLLDEKGKEEGCWYYVKPRCVSVKPDIELVNQRSS